MEPLNFVACGMMGDFFHSLFAVKNLCAKHFVKANVYITDNYGYGGDVWKFDINRTYQDIRGLMMDQPYINHFGILPADFKGELINLNDWRISVAKTHAETGKYEKCWSEVLSETYNFEMPSTLNYKWLSFSKQLHEFNGKILIHRSKHRHNGAFDWKGAIEECNMPMVFITTDESEYDVFEFKHPKISFHLATNLSEMAAAINSCEGFLGNQSAPLSIACGFDTPRICELDHDPAPFYMGEEKYSTNISWFLNETKNIFQL